MRRIKNIKSIEELSVYNKLIIEHSKILIKDQDLAQDIVQDAYIAIDKYLKKYPDKIIDGGFVSITIRNHYKNHLKAYTNKLNFGDKFNEAYIPDEEEDNWELLDKEIDEELFRKMENEISKLPLEDQALINATFQNNLKQISIKHNIKYLTVRTRYKEIKNILKEKLNGK